MDEDVDADDDRERSRHIYQRSLLYAIENKQWKRGNGMSEWVDSLSNSHPALRVHICADCRRRAWTHPIGHFSWKTLVASECILNRCEWLSIDSRLISNGEFVTFSSVAIKLLWQRERTIDKRTLPKLMPGEVAREEHKPQRERTRCLANWWKRSSQTCESEYFSFAFTSLTLYISLSLRRNCEVRCANIMCEQCKHARTGKQPGGMDMGNK